MKKIAKMRITVDIHGIPTCQKNELYIEREGYARHVIYPMIYMGSSREYEFDLDTDDVSSFFDSIDTAKWTIRRPGPLSNADTFSIEIMYDDGSTIRDRGLLSSDECFIEFDRKLAELVPFVEYPVAAEK